MPKTPRRVVIAFGPKIDARLFKDAFISVLNVSPEIHSAYFDCYSAENDTAHIVTVYGANTIDSVHELSHILLRFPKLRFLVASTLQNPMLQTVIHTYSHILGFKKCLEDNTARSEVSAFSHLPVVNEIADDLVEQISSDPDLELAFTLLGYPIYLLNAFDASPSPIETYQVIQS